MLAISLALEQALRGWGWIESNLKCDFVAATSTQASSECVFRHWLQLRAEGVCCLNERGGERVEDLLAAGWTLRCGWPRAWSGSIERWLGRRLVLAHASLFAKSTRFSSLVSSRIGRYGSGHPEWPRWLDGTLRHVFEHHGRLLISPGTTLAEMVEQFAIAAGMPFTKVYWNKQETLKDWLESNLLSHEPSKNAGSASLEKILLSPVVEPAGTELAAFPLQDRLSIAVADQVLSLTVRGGGKLEELLQRRLQDDAFPVGSVFVTLPAVRQSRWLPSKIKTLPSAEPSWLSRGAVGWIVATELTLGQQMCGHCVRTGDSSFRVESAASGACSPQQIVGPLPRDWRRLSANDDWPYFVHCTRATIGPWPHESEYSFRQRVWSQADSIVWQPLETLAKICRDGRLCATATITRTDARSVSFSAVPLVPLLEGRTFRAHLGRWDWEPYGLMIRREVLQAVGAVKVLYGDEADYADLSVEKKPYFQPRASQRGGRLIDWTVEREWRVVGDVWLSRLPADSVLLFVRSQIEAEQLARYASWPVLWVQ